MIGISDKEWFGFPTDDYDVTPTLKRIPQGYF